MTTLSEQEWREKREAHLLKVHPFTQASRDRAARRELHPIFDFFRRYYAFSFGRLEKWQPSAGVILEGADQSLFPPTNYEYSQDGSCSLDPTCLNEKQRERLRFTHQLLSLTQQRTGQFRCFGMHEWAMVYSGADVRHRESAPLRMIQSEIDRFVESRSLLCTHFDAFRFFAPDAQPLNKVQPTLNDREQWEQPGCIHANMDLYKWAYKSMPWVGSVLLYDCFLLALKAREIDMRASPYDLKQWGYAAIPIETPDGRSEYEREQRLIAEQGRTLRSRLIAAIAYALRSSDTHQELELETPKS